jgi:hypothetical protein
MRTEQYFMKPPAPGTTAAQQTLVTILDPVAGVRYVLDTQNKIAHRQAILPAKPAKKAPASGSNLVPWLIGMDGCCGVVNSPFNEAAADGLDWPAPLELEGLFADHPQATKPVGKKLGTQIIEGVRVQGIRYIDHGKWPSGAPVKRTEEIWTSPELRVKILSRDTLQTGSEIKNTEMLTHISRTEPDPALFQVPPEYRVVNETADFAIPFP